MRFKIIFAILCLIFLVSCEHYSEETTEKRTIATSEKRIVETSETIDETINPLETIKQYVIEEESVAHTTLESEYTNDNEKALPSRAGTPALLEELNNLVVNKEWTYGMSPVEWVYIPPNVQLISNYRPNSSKNYAIKSCVMSGERGCYMPVLSKTEMLSNDYDGRLYCFDDYTKIPPTEFRFKNTLNDLRYSEMSIEEILRNAFELTKTSNGLLKVGNSYINVVYVSDLDNIIATMG